MFKSDVDRPLGYGVKMREMTKGIMNIVNEDRSQGPPRLKPKVTNGQFPAFDINFEIYTMDVPPEVTSVDYAIAVNPDDEVYVGTTQ